MNLVTRKNMMTKIKKIYYHVLSLYLNILKFNLHKEKNIQLIS